MASEFWGLSLVLADVGEPIDSIESFDAVVSHTYDATSGEVVLRMFSESNKPMVLVGHEDPNADCMILGSGRDCFYTLTKGLLDSGHRKIAFVGGVTLTLNKIEDVIGLIDDVRHELGIESVCLVLEGDSPDTSQPFGKCLEIYR